jgi:lysophospholipase L1-like esterase
MELRKLFITAYLVFFSTFCLLGQHKVACVGNSITYGFGIAKRDTLSYPSQLGQLLGSAWEVRNFGVNGATLLKHGDNPYWNQKVFEEAKAFNPDVIVIKLGTNDTKPQNWKYKDEFIADYTALIKEFRSLPSKPLIFICLPAPAYGVRWNIRDSVINADVIPMLKRVARLNKVKIIDLNKPLRNHPEWFPDKIHPDETGAAKIAETVFASINKGWKRQVKKTKTSKFQ